jgi:hypothetical protein
VLASLRDIVLAGWIHVHLPHHRLEAFLLRHAAKLLGLAAREGRRDEARLRIHEQVILRRRALNPPVGRRATGGHGASLAPSADLPGGTVCRR